MRSAWHIFHLGIKELISLCRDPVLLFLIAYTFTFSVYTPAKSAVMDVVNASIAIVDEDNSRGRRAAVQDAMLPPLFLPPSMIPFSEINRGDGPRPVTPSSSTSRREFQADLARGRASPTSRSSPTPPR